jgi:hypothetical protein
LDYWEPAREGLRKAVQTTLLLTKIIIPVTFVVVTLNRFGLSSQLAELLSPLLKVVGLPGEAALPLFLGFFVNIYAAIGAISVLSLTAWQITIIAAMILTCHSLLMETPVLKLAGVHPAVAVLIRFGSSVILGLIFYLLFQVLGVL